MIAYFSLEWQVEKQKKDNRHVRSILIVDNSKKTITYAELTARGDVITQQDGPVQAYAGARFGEILSEIKEQWGEKVDFTSFSAGHDWKIKMRSKSGKVYRIKGNELPPSSRIIENEVISLSKEAGIKLPSYSVL